MRKGTHHSPESRLAIRLNRLRKSMPPDAFAEFMAADGALKWCPACRQLLPVSEFHKNKRTWDGLYDRCKACNAEVVAANNRERSKDPEWRERKNQRARDWREANQGENLKRSYKDYNLRQLYGITLERFETMLAGQGGRCAICRKPFPSALDTHVDHDHATGRVRGILCSACNNGLGRFRDNPAVLRRAASYLERVGRHDDPGPDEDHGQGSLWDGDSAA
jgi:hypothetical protein